MPRSAMSRRQTGSSRSAAARRSAAAAALNAPPASAAATALAADSSVAAASLGRSDARSDAWLADADDDGDGGVSSCARCSYRDVGLLPDVERVATSELGGRWRRRGGARTRSVNARARAHARSSVATMYDSFYFEALERELPPHRVAPLALADRNVRRPPTRVSPRLSGGGARSACGARWHESTRRSRRFASSCRAVSRRRATRPARVRSRRDGVTVRRSLLPGKRRRAGAAPIA